MEATYRNSGKIGLIGLILIAIVFLFTFRISPLEQPSDTPIFNLLIIIFLLGTIFFVWSVLLLLAAKPTSRTAKMGKIEWALHCGKKVAVGLVLIGAGKLMIYYEEPLLIYTNWEFDIFGNILIITAWIINIISASIFLSGLRVVFWLKILAASILLIVVGFSLQNATGILSLIAGLLLLLFAIGTMHSETQQSIAISHIRNTVAQMGFAPNEVEEITSDVVKNLKTGKYKRLDGSESLVQAVADISVSPAEWTNFTGDQLASAIKFALDIRDRKKGMR